MRYPAFIRRCITDKHGNIVIWQRPNLPLATGVAAFCLGHVVPYGQLNFTVALIEFGALFTWAWMELFSGSSLFRRAVGCVGLIVLIISRI